jgi:hypothetical protein
MVQLPTHNTPQFDWARNKTARRQPGTFNRHRPFMLPKSPPEPSLRAATDTPCEIWLGRATIEAILGTYCCPACSTG